MYRSNVAGSLFVLALLNVNHAAHARFISEDPMGFEGGDVNFYAYAGNNPVNRNDPTGNYAEVAVNGNNVNIVVPIRYSGWAMTDRNVAAFNRGIESKWSGQVGNYNVTTTVKQLSFFESLFTSNSRQNFVEIKPQSTLPGGRSSIDCVAGGGCRGEWRGNGPDLAGMAAHETGHILRLDDQYRPDGTAQPGYSGNIMGPRVGGNIGSVWPQDIQQTIQTSQGGWQRVPQGPHEPFDGGSAGGGFLLYPNMNNTNMMQSVYRK